MSGGFFRGTSADQDTRISNKQAKLLKTQKFAQELEHLVDMTKVKMDVMKPWIATRVTELLGFEDEVLINFIFWSLGSETGGKMEGMMGGVSYQRFPKVKLRELKDDYAKFELRDTDASMANALRRVMIAEVPTVAIDLVEIEVNSSVLNDESIAHHLGLILLSSDRAMSMCFSRDCDGDGQCEFCSVEFHLLAKCIGDHILDVTSEDHSFFKATNQCILAGLTFRLKEEACEPVWLLEQDDRQELRHRLGRILALLNKT
ncbi:hypothetical protein MLD38_014542 [Melastoma candidum]|uniref:Uncharacterized protein n=1 Tax=Melastoma candidum TaxID=119954 RepID=A0ACB9RCQ9_9MYRT|nr:hypothetical protein MLD38_014542 [Melastoma candidum]